MAAASITATRDHQAHAHKSLSKDLALESAKRRAAEERARRKHEIEKIMRKYDADNSGSLGHDELKLLLKDFSVMVVGEEISPSEDDLEFLLAISDDSLAAKAESIDTRHVHMVCDSWANFLMQRDLVRQLLAKYDKDSSLRIGQDELQDILNGLNSGVAVPEDVTKWVMRQGDLVGDGEMGEMELSRAITAFEKWREKQQRFAQPGNHQPLPRPQQPTEYYAPPPSSACCVIS
mmetsp:Transcript_2419/g.5167  ORF Transcript_2419/g.5167 Transcript_2419/m.5167 type:complete len:234 (+) Transcript_2419:112-813(+)|eukprot:CAMPEP_0178421780 /NCGR_PEP_ID=MMETSP0689_2-20121128/26826_1 /TAXON_ID=160604 /ORGANISM="Amphidinium massartii, Strain CS-259" /LENGTH=233 /DNA_ID=CAMNT_0020043307 /DNA_START=20 /DNA_END=721 /DNA_ORIENTATION=-